MGEAGWEVVLRVAALARSSGMVVAVQAGLLEGLISGLPCPYAWGRLIRDHLGRADSDSL